MASVEKFSAGAVRNQIRHNSRDIHQSSNRDIVPALSCQNYDLTPARDIADPFQYYKHRLREVFCYNRDDVKVAAGWVVTLPKGVTDEAQQRAFFEETARFLTARYGQENVIQIVVHYDEGKREVATDRWGNIKYDNDGAPLTELVCGQPHLHFLFIPVVPDSNPRHQQTEKVCAKEVLTRTELQHFHQDLQADLNAHGIDAAVVTGAVRKQGRNYTVKELKKAYDFQLEMERTQEIERSKSRWS